MNCRLKSRGWLWGDFCALAHGNSPGVIRCHDAPVTLPPAPAGSLRDMKLAELQVLHLDGGASKLAAADLALVRDSTEAWVIGTCQRTVIIAWGRKAPAQIAERL